MTKIRLKPELLSLLESDKFKTFTATELIHAYLQLPNCIDLKRTAARQFIHRNLSRLESRGFIQILNSGKEGVSRYRLSNKFTKNHITTGKPHRSAVKTPLEPPAGVSLSIKEKLKHQKLELLTTIGELEEYEAIGRESPQPNEQIQHLYNKARDHYSKTLGRIRALESLISYQ